MAQRRLGPVIRPERPLVVVADTMKGGLGEPAIDQLMALRRFVPEIRLAAPGSSPRISAPACLPIDMPSSVRDVPAMWSAARQLRRHLRSFAVRPVVHAHGLRSMAVSL